MARMMSKLYHALIAAGAEVDMARAAAEEAAEADTAELKADLTSLRADFANLRSEIKTDFRWIVGLILTTAALNTGAVVALATFLTRK